MTEHVDIICIYDNDNFSAPIEYTFALILSTFDVRYKIISLRQLMQEGCYPHKALFVSYTHDYINVGAEKQIHIYASDFFGKNYLKPASLPQTPLKKYNGLPVIYYGHGAFERWARKSEGLIETNVDIIASSFFMLSRYEEVVSAAKDRYGRFPASASLAFKEGFLNRPVVNEYIELIRKWIKSFGFDFKRKKLWGSKDFAVCLTHDIDEIDKYKFYPPLGTIRRLVANRKVTEAWAVFVDYLQVRASLADDPYRIALDRIVNLELECGFTSSLYLMPEGIRYSLDDPYLQNAISKLRSAGFEIGIHPDYDSSNDAESLKAQKKKLEAAIGDNIVGGRLHYLKWKIPEMWEIWEAAGLVYDTTLGFSDCEGFRCGICYPFRPFDLIANRVINVWELPLTVMDGTLATYRKMSPVESLKTLVSLLDCVQRYGGVFVLLLHPSYFSELLAPDWTRCFEGFYNIICARNALVGSAASIIHEWADSTRRNLFEPH